MRNERLGLLSIATVVVLAACAPPAGDSAGGWAESAVNDLVRRWDGAMASGDPAQVAALYSAADPAVMPPDRAVHLGPIAVEVYFRNRMAEGGIDVRNRVDRVLSSGDLIVARGTYTLAATGDADPAAEEIGKWTAVARRAADGSLAIVRNLWNRDAAPAGSAPSPPIDLAGAPAAAVDAPCPDSPSALDEAFAEHWAQGDVATLIALHAEQGTRLPPRRPTLEGPDEIGAFLQSRGEHFSFGRLLRFDTGEAVQGDVGATWGRYRIAYVFEGDVGRIDGQGKYIAVATRGPDDCWRYEWVIWNNDEPWPRAEP